MLSWSHLFGVTAKPVGDYILQHISQVISDGSKDIEIESTENCCYQRPNSYFTR